MVSPKADFTREKKLFSEVPESQIANTKEYYEMYMTAEQTYQKPGCPGRRTVQKLFKFWNGEHMDEYDKMPTNDRQVIAKGRAGGSFSQILYKLNYQLSLIENQVEEERKIHQFKMEELAKKNQADKVVPYRVNIPLETLRLKVMHEIFELLDAIAALEITPTAYEMQDNRILETLQQRQDMLMKRFNRLNERRNQKRQNETNADLV